MGVCLALPPCVQSVHTWHAVQPETQCSHAALRHCFTSVAGTEHLRRTIDDVVSVLEGGSAMSARRRPPTPRRVRQFYAAKCNKLRVRRGVRVCVRVPKHAPVGPSPQDLEKRRRRMGPSRSSFGRF